MVVQQALHGYSNGHRLLACSTSVSREAERAMAILSDLSGNTGGQTFEPYITGYPLSSSNLYALARTWPATEMSRPGCVWTHTLLIRFKDFPIRTALGDLLSFFHRPRNNENFADYEQELSVDTAPDRERRMGPKLDHAYWVIDVIESLYDKRVPLLVVGDGLSVDDAILEIWAQQWSTLQHGFRFCTGAIGPRRSDDSMFDVQSVPRQFYRRSKWADAKVALLHLEKVSAHLEAEPWIRIAVEDVKDPGSNRLREFLDRTGPEFKSDFVAFKKLATVFALLAVATDSTEVENVIAKISDQFPGPQEARSLKACLFGVPSNFRETMLPNITDVTILSCLLRSASTTAFDPKELCVASRAAAAWREGNSEQNLEFLSLAWEHRDTELGRDVLEGLAEELTPRELIDFGSEGPGLIAWFVSIRPILLAYPEVWRHCSRELGTIKQAVRSLPSLAQSDARRVVMAAMSADVGAVAEDLEEAFGSSVGIWIMDWANEQSERGVSDISKAWDRVLKQHEMLVLTRLAENQVVSGISVELLARALGPRAPDSLSGGAKVWSEVLRKIRGGVDALDAPTKAFLLTVGLSESGASAKDLIAFSFDSVHGSLLKDKLPFKTWDQLQKPLPWLSWLDSWDKAERLRRGVASWFVSKSRPLSELLAVTDNPKTLEQLLRSVLQVEQGRHYLASGYSELGTSKEKPKLANWKLDLLEEIVGDTW